MVTPGAIVFDSNAIVGVSATRSTPHPKARHQDGGHAPGDLDFLNAHFRSPGFDQSSVIRSLCAASRLTGARSTSRVFSYLADDLGGHDPR